MTPDELALKEREVKALETLAAAQAVVAGCVADKAKEGTRWQKVWYGGDGGAGARSSNMRMSY